MAGFGKAAGVAAEPPLGRVSGETCGVDRDRGRGREANPSGKRQSQDPGQGCPERGGTPSGERSTGMQQEGQAEAEKETQKGGETGEEKVTEARGIQGL